MSNITSCDSGSFSTENNREDAAKQPSLILGQLHSPNSHASTTTNNSNKNSQPPPLVKKKRNLPGNPDPSAEVVALSPNTLVTTNRFVCEICHKGFQRDQNLQLHRRGHNLPWKLKQRTTAEVRKRVYVCPEPSCVHHNPARALGDLTGIKKHFSRKHGEKKWKCDKCSKKYAVRSDWKAHSKICGTKEYKCDCGTIFSRRDSFITHRAFCDALAEENNKQNEGIQLSKMGPNLQNQPLLPNLAPAISLPIINNTNIDQKQHLSSSLPHHHHELLMTAKPFNINMAAAASGTTALFSSPSLLQLGGNSNNMLDENNMLHNIASPHMSATALLQKAAQMGATVSSNTNNSGMAPPSQSSFGVHVMNHQHVHLNGQHDMNVSSLYDVNQMVGSGGTGAAVGMSGLEMFNAILDQSKALSRIIAQNSTITRSSSLHGECDLTSGGGGGSNALINGGSEDVMTLDLLGIGGGGGSAHGGFYGGDQRSERDDDEMWRNWSNKNAGFESFSATGSI